MNTIHRFFIRRLALALLMTGAAISSAQAGQAGKSPQAQWESECSACHVLYSPRMLPAESWRAVMSGLDRHFGADASLDSATTQKVGGFLERNAGRASRSPTGKPLLRITEARWFVREHRKLSKTVWTSDLVKSPANCTACHAREPGGNYSERDVNVPR